MSNLGDKKKGARFRGGHNVRGGRFGGVRPQYDPSGGKTAMRPRKKQDSFREQRIVFFALLENGESHMSAAQIGELCPDLGRSEVSFALNALRNKGIIERAQCDDGITWYRFTESAERWKKYYEEHDDGKE